MNRWLRRAATGLPWVLVLGLGRPEAALAQDWAGTSRGDALGRGDAAVELARLTGEIRLDGTPDEAAWREVDPLPLTMYAPVFRGRPTQRTEIRVAYDDGHLYAAGWFFDDDPAGIRVNSLYRDRWNGDDAFAMYVDAFNDKQNSKWFGTTAAGMRFDLLVSDDGLTLNDSWDAFWDAESTRTDEGWFTEVRIPFSTLGFQVEDGEEVLMGLTVTRLVSRSGERVTFPEIDPAFQFRQPSVAREVVLREVESSRPVYITPYALTSLDRRPLPQPSTVGRTDSEVTGDIGLDLRYALSGNMNLDLTVNTDFAQVEADEEQVNLDRFPLFFPEKRRFFQEGSGLFEYATGAGSRLFHSRRIGLTDDRETVPVIAGARLVGRSGEWDIGILDMQTSAVETTPTENFGVARVRRRVLNENSFLGALVTSRARAGRHNVAGGVDGLFRVVGENYLTVKWVTSTDERVAPTSSLLDQSIYYASWQKRTNRGLAFTVSTSRSGVDYRPEVGFLPRHDYWTLNSVADWYFFTDSHPYFRRVWPGALAFSTFRNSDGVLESGQYAVWLQWDTKRGGGGWIEPKVFREDVVAPFLVGGEAPVPAGSYTFADLQIVWNMPPGARLRTGIDARAGTYFDGTRQQVRLTPTWNVSPHLELGGEYLFSRIRFAERGEGTDIHVPALRIRTALDARASGNALIQYNSTTDRIDFNIRLRYNFSEGTDLWLVYNEGLDTDRGTGPEDVRSPLSLSRSVILKYTHTFSPS
ncbi:MAG: carbohydrate binding family 9 domain-containing protein [Gemmatimonadota bacterium]|nr:carbohydrate binding family 9 domain-containing protein [Gemmatimonadota bacterium]